MKQLILLLYLAQLTFAADVAITGAVVFPAPDRPPIEHAVILIHNGKISALGSVPVPGGTQRLDYGGCFIMAGFWNSHVHVFTPDLLHADQAPAAQLNTQMELLFNRWGFTTVFDIASILRNTLALRRRIDRGEVRGPHVLTTGEPLWTVPPVYVKQFLLEQHIEIPAVHSAAEARRQVSAEAAAGANGTKLFTGSLQNGAIANMPLDIVRAAAAEAHRHHLPVFAHPQNSEGVEVAIQGGVDILAHTVPQAADWDSKFVPRLIAAHMALIPTLTLFDFEARKAQLSDADREGWLAKMVAQLKSFFNAGGQILFGTDIGYTDHFDTTLEYQLMARAGMDYRAILASLTTNPAQRFGFQTRRGRIEPGMDADLVVLDSDPRNDIAAFSKVRAAIKGGIVTFSRP